MASESQQGTFFPSCFEQQQINVCTEKPPEWETELIDWLDDNNHWLQNRCNLRLGNRADAEDAVQEVTITVIDAIDQFHGRSTLRTWVMRIADNHCYSLIKRRSASAMTDHLMHCILLFETDRQSDLFTVKRIETAEQVHATLGNLTHANREILRLRYSDEYFIKQMSSLLDLSLSATKMRLYRAMDTFKQKYIRTRYYQM